MRSTIHAEETTEDRFTSFVQANQDRLRHALVAGYGWQAGREAAEEALVYGWEHWDRVEGMDNPSVYLYRVGARRAQALKRQRPKLLFPPPPAEMLDDLGYELAA